MKCSAIKLSDRKTQTLHEKNTSTEKHHPIVYPSQKFYGYNNPYSKINLPAQNNNASLKITTIALPKNIRTFNKNSSIKNWTRKRSIIKTSSQMKQKSAEKNEIFDEYESYLPKEHDLKVSDEEVDPDVQGLDASHRKKRKKKIIKVSLSRPPSPETLQVIRVDVVSNFSVEEPESASEKDEEIQRKSTRKNFVLKCNKVSLAARGSIN